MPRFYFDLVKRPGVALRDERGAEFPDLPAAIADAEQGFAEILGAQPLPFARRTLWPSTFATTAAIF
jgi:hypothetical protein